MSQYTYNTRSGRNGREREREKEKRDMMMGDGKRRMRQSEVKVYQVTGSHHHSSLLQLKNDSKPTLTLLTHPFPLLILSSPSLSPSLFNSALSNIHLVHSLFFSNTIVIYGLGFDKSNILILPNQERKLQKNGERMTEKGKKNHRRRRKNHREKRERMRSERDFFVLDLCCFGMLLIA